MSENEDSQKLKILSNEYTKIKKHNSILKKAILEEQEKSSQLENKLKIQTEKLSSYSEEIDTLSFNNNRLIKRVQVLQEELEHEKNNSPSGGWFGTGAKQELAKTKQELERFKEELDVKINENEELHILVYNLKLEHKTIKEDILERMDKLKHNLKLKDDEISKINEKNEDEMKKLIKEIEEVKSSNSELFDQINNTKATMALNEMEFKSIQSDLTEKLKEVQKSFDRKVQFNDTANETYNAYNISCIDSNKLILSSIVNISSTFAQNLKSYFNFENERCDNLSFLLTNNAHKQTILTLRQKRNNIIELINDLLSGFKKFLHGNGNKQNVVKYFNNVVEEYRLFSECYLSYIELENTHLNYMTVEMKNVNASIGNNFTQIYHFLVKMTPHFNEYVDSVENPLDSLNTTHDLSNWKNNIIGLRDLLRTQCKSLGELIQLEHLHISTQDRVINEKKLSVMLDIVSFWDKLTTQIKDYVSSASNSTRSIPKQKIASNINYNTNKSKSYLAKLNLSYKDHISIPYTDQLSHLASISNLKDDLMKKNNEISNVTNSFEKQQSIIESLKNELVSAKETIIIKNKKANELLSELGDTKLRLQQISNNEISEPVNEKRTEKVTQDSIDLINWDNDTVNVSANEHTIINSSDDLLSFDIPNPQQNENLILIEETPSSTTVEKVNEDEKWSFIVFDESGKQSNHLLFTEEEGKREIELKKFYETKTNVLNGQVDIANKKVNELNRKCIELDRKLRDTVHKKEELVKMIENTQKLLVESKEETESTRSNLQEQLELLTEHFVSVNDKIGIYKDELESLKRCVVRCGKCKTWNSIEWLMGEGQMGKKCSKGDHPTSFNFA